MMKRSLFRRVVLAGLALMLVSGLAVAQTGGNSPSGKSLKSAKHLKVGDAELKRFASTLNDVHVIQVGFQKGFQQAVTSSALGQKQFLNIYRSERRTKKLPTNLTPAQKRQYHQLMTKVVGMERQAQKRMVAIVKKDGFTVSRFDAIIQAVHSDPSLASRLKKVRK